MSITADNTEGIQVLSAAMDETLGSQTQQTGNNTVVVSDDIVTAGNGNITAPTGYVGRMCIIRQGAGDEETRLITAEVAGTGNTIILTVGEDWVDVPVASTDTIHVSYSLDDMEAFSGMVLIATNGIYEGGTTREWQVGNGTAFAYLAAFNYQFMQLPDRGATEPGWTVRNNGRFDSGFVQAGKGIQGTIMFSVNNAASEESIEIEAGGILRCYASTWSSNLEPTGFIVRAGVDGDSDGFSIKDLTDECLILDGTWRNLAVAGSGGSTELLRLAEETVILGAVFVDLVGLTTEASDSSTETITIRDAAFINVSPILIIEANKTFKMINPVWTIDEASQNDISFPSATANGADEEYSLDPIVQDAAGVKKNGARVFMYEGLRLDDLVLELTADSDGLAPDSWVYKNFTNQDGVAEVSTITCRADVGGDLDNTYLTLSTPTTNYYVWWNVSGGGDPAPGGTGIEVSISTNDTANTVASLTQSAIDAVTGLGAGVSTNVVTVTNDDAGTVPDIADVDSGHTVGVTTQGVDASLSVLTDGDHALRVDNYGDFPFVAAQISNEKFAGAVVLNPDPSVVEPTQATAITDGSGVTFNTDTNPSDLFGFDTGSGTLAVGMILTFSGGATGEITESKDGDSVSGVLHLKDRNATAIGATDTFSRTGGTAGTFSGTCNAAVNPVQSFSRWIEGNGKSYQVIHDYFAARTAQDSGGFTAEAEIIHEWGRSSQQRALYLGADGWFTERAFGLEIVTDVYAGSNVNLELPMFAGSNTSRGQAFTASVGGLVSKVSFWMKRLGTPGDTQVNIWSLTGTYGSTATPNAKLGGVSDSIPGADFDLSVFEKITYEFPDGFLLVQGSTYFVTVEHAAGDSGNQAIVGSDSTSPTHGGNAARFTSPTWTAVPGQDIPFEVEVRNDEGVIVINGGAGAVEKFTDDVGVAFVPPTTITITYTNLVNDTEIRVYEAGTSNEIAGIEDVVGNQFAWSVAPGESMDIKIYGPIPPPPSPPGVAYQVIQEYGVSFTLDTTLAKNQQINRNYFDGV